MTTIYHAIYASDGVSDAVLTEEIKKAREQLHRAVTEKGADYVYPRAKPGAIGSDCLYLEYERIEDDEDNGRQYIGPKCPSCLVGHVLVGLEVPFSKITIYEGENAEEASQEAFTSDVVRAALCRAQGIQDGGDTWGAAVEAFEAYIRDNTSTVTIDE